MKPRLRPLSEKNQTIPSQVVLEPTTSITDSQECSRQAALHSLRRRITLARETCPVSTPFSLHCRAIVWSWWRNLLQTWPEQQGSCLVPVATMATALQAAEVSVAANTTLPIGHEQVDPARRQRLFCFFPKALRRVLPENPLNTDTSTLTH